MEMIEHQLLFLDNPGVPEGIRLQLYLAICSTNFDSASIAGLDFVGTTGMVVMTNIYAMRPDRRAQMLGRVLRLNAHRDASFGNIPVVVFDM
jgi:hypothetical protein